MKRPIEYEKFSKEQLIKRLKKLEGFMETRKQKIERPFHFSSYPVKHIALKIAYFGWHYNGFASQISYKPSNEDTSNKEIDQNYNAITVEDLLFAALLKTKLIESPQSCNYSRCGRTDTGVSSIGQVVALTVRSSAKKGPSNEFGVPICTMLNRTLPSDIRILGWSLVPESFNARFDCTGREYRYFFSGLGLNITLMREAAKKLVGSHDFRNFCRRDPSREIKHYIREIFVAEIVEIKDEMCYFRIHGSAFLYHQVRCTMEMLYLVGRGLEPPDVIDYMLDPERCKDRPSYKLASEIPLILLKCFYPETFNIDWNIDDTEKKHLNHEIFIKWQDLQIKAMTVDLIRNKLDINIPFSDKTATKTIFPKGSK